MTDEELKHFRELSDTATPGPWIADGWNIGPEAKQYPGEVDGKVAERAFGANDANDAAFIAAARTAVPALLDEVERLRRLVFRDR